MFLFCYIYDVFSCSLQDFVAAFALVLFISAVQALNLLEGILPGKDVDTEKPTAPLSSSILERYFIFSMMWSVGALLELSDRAKVEEFLRAKNQVDLPSIPADSGNTIFEYVVNSETGKLLARMPMPTRSILLQSIMVKHQVQ